MPERDGDPSARRRPWAKLVALALVVLVLWLYLRRHSGELGETLRLRPGLLLPLALLEAILLFLRGLLTRSLCLSFRVRLGVVEATKLAAWTSFANYVTPFVGGSGVRAVYLKRRHQLPYSSFVSVQAATYTLHFMIASALGLACLALLSGIAPPLRNALAIGLAAVLLGCLLLHHWPFRAPTGASRPAVLLRQVLVGWEEIRQAALAPLVGLLVVNAAVQALAIWLAFALVGIPAGVLQVLFVASLYSLSILIAVTPAALGVSEGTVAFSAAVVGLGAPAALTAAAARRVIAFLVTALLAGAASLVAEPSDPGATPSP